MNASLMLFFLVVYVYTGHGKFETLGALGISCMLLTTAGGIGWHAIDLLFVQLLTSSYKLTLRFFMLLEYLLLAISTG